jgi:thiamine biosynthesis lipoprotein
MGVLLVCGLTLLIFGIYVWKNVARPRKYSETKLLMGTYAQLDVCESAQNIEDAYTHVWERLEDIAWRMNVFDERSDVARINSAQFEPAYVGRDTYYVLERSANYSKTTGGAFDITVEPLIELWRDSADKNILPEQVQIDPVLAAVGSGNVELLSENRVRLKNPRTKIDLGGIAAGYAVDEAARIFREHGIMDFYIDIGGDLYAGGKNCAGRLWRIGIRDPRDRAKIIDVVEVSDRAVVTSGNYEKYLVIQGEQWSHIFDPRTGYPQKDVVSATVISEMAIDADAIATALCVLGSGDGTVYIDSLPEPFASLIIVRQESGEIQQFPSRQYSKYQHGGKLR